MAQCLFDRAIFDPAVFDVCRPHVGWPEWRERFRHRSEELEARLRRQRGDTFGPHWYEGYLAARTAASERIESSTSAILAEAIEAADKAVLPETAAPLAQMLNAAATATRLTASHKHARAILDYVEYDDDEEVIEMLLLH